jgi:hypothetical protein
VRTRLAEGVSGCVVAKERERGSTELVVGAEDANVFFLIAEEDVNLLCKRVNDVLQIMCPG